MKFIARKLRWLANLLDPLPKREVVTPLEFIPTKTLANEIRERNDCIIFYGKVRRAESGFGDIQGEHYWRLVKGHAAPVLEKMATDILEHFEQSENETKWLGEDDQDEDD